MKHISAEVILDSVTRTGQRITTVQVVAPKFLDAEFRTHRMFSQNSSSSRAISAERLMEDDYFLPSDIREKEGGMQGYTKLSGNLSSVFLSDLRKIRSDIVNVVRLWSGKIHKQHLNRYLDPFAFQKKLITSTEWDNFFKLRLALDAQPEIQEAAKATRHAIDKSIPKERHIHLPYLSSEEMTDLVPYPDKACMLSAGRCARISYSNGKDGKFRVWKDDLDLAKRLLLDGHMTPFEHQAWPMERLYWNNRADIRFAEKGVTAGTRDGLLISANFHGWIQNRQYLQQRNLEV